MLNFDVKITAFAYVPINMDHALFSGIHFENKHWRRSALNSAGALQVRGGEFRGIFTPFYTIKFRGLYKSGGAGAPAAPPSSAPMKIKYPQSIYKRVFVSVFIYLLLLKNYCTIQIV